MWLLLRLLRSSAVVTSDLLSRGLDVSFGSTEPRVGRASPHLAEIRPWRQPSSSSESSSGVLVTIDIAVVVTEAVAHRDLGLDRDLVLVDRPVTVGVDARHRALLDD